MRTLEEALRERLAQKQRRQDEQHRQEQVALASLRRREAEAATAFRAQFEGTSGISLEDCDVSAREIIHSNHYNPYAYYQAYVTFANGGQLKYLHDFCLIDGAMIVTEHPSNDINWSASLPGETEFSQHFRNFTDAAIYATRFEGIAVELVTLQVAEIEY